MLYLFGGAASYARLDSLLNASRVRIPLARNIFSRDGKLKKRNYICFSAFVCEETQGIFCFDFLLPNYLRRNVRFKASLWTTFHEFPGVYPEFVENLLTSSTLKLSISTFRLAALLTRFVVSRKRRQTHSTGSDEVFPLSLGVESADESHVLRYVWCIFIFDFNSRETDLAFTELRSVWFIFRHAYLSNAFGIKRLL